MRKINHLVLHCSAGPDGVVKSREQLVKEHQARGFRTIGYHYIIEPDGSIVVGRSEEEVGAHVEGHNANSLGICMIGTLRFTHPQWYSLSVLMKRLMYKFPEAKVCGHRDFSPDLNHNGKIEPNEWIKLCPNFDAQDWLLAGMTPKKENML